MPSLIKAKRHTNTKPLSRLSRSFKQLEETYWDIRRIYGRWKSDSRFIKKALKEDENFKETATPEVLKKIVAKEDKYAKLIRMQSFVFYIAMFEYFIRKSYEVCLLNDYRLCFQEGNRTSDDEDENQGKKQSDVNKIALEKIFQDISIQDLRTLEIERLARTKIEHKEFKKIHNFFTNNINFTYKVPTVVVNEIERARQSRHLILHNGVKIDQGYIDKKFAKQYQLGQKLQISRKYLSDSSRIMMTYSKVLYESIKKILLKKS